jgi:hypothetical protein
MKACCDALDQEAAKQSIPEAAAQLRRNAVACRNVVKVGGNAELVRAIAQSSIGALGMPAACK